jgi:hypothetical protein
MEGLVGGHKQKFSINSQEIVKNTSPLEANFYRLHGEQFSDVLPRYRFIEDMRSENSIGFTPLGLDLIPDSDDAPGASTSWIGSGLKYMDVKVGNAFSPYEAVRQHPHKWGNLTPVALEQKIQKRLDKEERYGQAARGFRVVNYTGATQASTYAKTRMTLANQDTTDSFCQFFEKDTQALSQAKEQVTRIRETVASIEPFSLEFSSADPQSARSKGALGFIAASVLFAYHPDNPGRVEAKIIDFGHYLIATAQSSAQHCQETALVRAAFLMGLERLEAALALASGRCTELADIERG